MTWATSHNGGRTQIGCWFYPSAGDFPILNLFKGAQQWSNITGGESPSVSILNTDGYVTSIASGGVTTIVYVPAQASRSGDYKVTWDGSGTLTFAGGSLVSGDTNTSGYVFTPSTTRLTFNISALGGTPITNIKLFHVDDETAINAGEVWGTKFLERLNALKPGAIRFLDWQDGNFGNLVFWANRRSATCYSYRDSYFPSSLYAGDTTYALNGSSNDYAVDLGASLPTNRQVVMARFNQSSAGATNTFSIDNGVTKYPVLRPFADATTSSARWPVTNRIATFIFDSEIQSWLKFGGDGTEFSQGIRPGLPYELMVDLCATVGAHPYFVTPYLAAESPSDLMSSLATYIRDSGPSWMIPRFEGPNETWNNLFYSTSFGNVKQLVRNGGSTSYNVTAFSSTGTGSSGSSTLTIGTHTLPLGARVLLASLGGVFGINTTTPYVTAKTSTTVTVNVAPTGGTYTSGGTVVGASGDNNNWYGEVVSLLGQTISTIYSNDRSRYHLICGIQTSVTPSNSDPRLGSYSYVFRNSDTALAAKNWVTHICPSQYFTPSSYGSNLETQYGFNYAVTYASDPTNQASILASYATSLATGTSINGGPSVAALDTLHQGFKTWAQGFGVQKMCGYEGGYSPDYYAHTATYTSAISAATQANPCVLTLATTVNPSNPSGNSNTTTPAAVVGMNLTIASVGGMTQLNGNTYAITKVGVADGLSATQVAINVDASAFSAYTSGGVATYQNMARYVDALRYGSKSLAVIFDYQRDVLDNFFGMTDGTYTAEFPAHYFFSGSSTGPVLDLLPGQNSTTGVWGLFDPDIYRAPNATYDAIRLRNNHLRRFKILT